MRDKTFYKVLDNLDREVSAPLGTYAICKEYHKLKLEENHGFDRDYIINRIRNIKNPYQDPHKNMSFSEGLNQAIKLIKEL